MSDEDKKVLSESIFKLTDQVTGLGWAVANLTAILKEILEELKRKK